MISASVSSFFFFETLTHNVVKGKNTKIWNSRVRLFVESAFRNHPTRKFIKISALGIIVSWKIVSGISFSSKIVCAFAKFWTRSPGKFGCVLVHFASPGKFTCVLVPFLVLLEILMCSYKESCLLLENLSFLITSNPPGKFDVF